MKKTVDSRPKFNWKIKEKLAHPDADSQSISRKTSFSSFSELVKSASLFSSEPKFKGKPTLVPQESQPCLLFTRLELQDVRDYPKIYSKRLIPLCKCVFTSNLRKFKMLLQDESIQVDEKDPLHGFTALHLSVQMGLELFVKELLMGLESDAAESRKAFANPNVTDLNQRTPLMLALAHANSALCDILIESGADIEAVDRVGMRPIHYAFLTGTTELIEKLLGCGVDINAKDKTEKALLHHAIEKRQSSLALFLIEKGCDIHAKDSSQK